MRLSTKLQPIIFIMVMIKSDYMGRSLPMHFKLIFIFQLMEDLQIGALGARALVPAALVGRKKDDIVQIPSQNTEGKVASGD